MAYDHSTDEHGERFLCTWIMRDAERSNLDMLFDIARASDIGDNVSGYIDSMRAGILRSWGASCGLSDDECFKARKAQGNLGAHAPACYAHVRLELAVEWRVGAWVEREYAQQEARESARILDGE